MRLLLFLKILLYLPSWESLKNYRLSLVNYRFGQRRPPSWRSSCWPSSSWVSQVWWSLPRLRRQLPRPSPPSSRLHKQTKESLSEDGASLKLVREPPARLHKQFTRERQEIVAWCTQPSKDHCIPLGETIFTKWRLSRWSWPPDGVSHSPVLVQRWRLSLIGLGPKMVSLTHRSLLCWQLRSLRRGPVRLRHPCQHLNLQGSWTINNYETAELVHDC